MPGSDPFYRITSTMLWFVVLLLLTSYIVLNAENINDEGTTQAAKGIFFK